MKKFILISVLVALSNCDFERDLADCTSAGRCTNGSGGGTGSSTCTAIHPALMNDARYQGASVNDSTVVLFDQNTHLFRVQFDWENYMTATDLGPGNFPIGPGQPVSIVSADYDYTTSSTVYRSVSGNASITSIYRASSTHLKATISDVVLVEWSQLQGAAIPDGGCVEVDNLSIDTIVN